jgi:hypothetical protein
MISPLPPFGSSSIFENYQGLITAGPAPGIPVVQQQRDLSFLHFPLAYFGASGDDGFWANYACNAGLTQQGQAMNFSTGYYGNWITGRVRMAPGVFNIQSTIKKPPFVYLEGSGPGTVLVANMTGTSSTALAPVISCHFPASGPQTNVPALPTMGGIRDLRIDGLNCGNYAAGIDTGGGWGHKVIDVTIVNFNQLGSIGLHLNNAPDPEYAEWTEKGRIICHLMHNATACMIENTTTNTNSDSFEYNDITLYMIADKITNPVTQRGLVLNNGGYLSGGTLFIRGNFPDNSGPIITLEGNDGAGGYSNIFHEHIQCVVEYNGTGTPPQTINFGATQNTIHNSYGALVFQFNAFTPSNGVAGQLSFGGDIEGDATLTSIRTAPTGWV